MRSQEKVSEWQILKDEQLSPMWVKRKKAFQASTGLGQRHRSKTQLCLGNSMHDQNSQFSHTFYLQHRDTEGVLGR